MSLFKLSNHSCAKKVNKGIQYHDIVQTNAYKDGKVFRY
jgi:hypothetical protein